MTPAETITAAAQQLRTLAVARAILGTPDQP